jgi:AraC-like DNA-binding protein
MINQLKNFAETTVSAQIGSVLDDTLRSLRIRGSVLLRETYAEPWAIAIPDAAALARLLGVPSDTRVVAFHLVEFGHCEIHPEGGDRTLLTAGEMALCVGGSGHHIAAGRGAKVQEIAGLLAGEPNTQHPDASGRPASTSLLCGAFLLEQPELNPLLAALPPVMVSNLSRTGELHNLSGVARLLAEEIDRSHSGNGYVAERLLEVLCAETLRAQAEAGSRQDAGWFRALKDPVVGKAIAAIHARPGEDWSVPRLAQAVAMSPSRFAARFSGCLGDSPMAYVARWRMSLACRRLATTRTGIDRVAGDLGYESVAAFNRAFKKLVGMPPAAWRARATRSADGIR